MRVTITQSEINNSRFVEQLLFKTKNKFTELQQSGAVKNFKLYPENFQSLANKNKPILLNSENTYTIVCGQARPDLPGLFCDFKMAKPPSFFLKFAARQELVKTWKWEWLNLFVEEHLPANETSLQIDFSQILYALLSYQNSKELAEFQIELREKNIENNQVRPFKILIHPQSRDISLQILNLEKTFHSSIDLLSKSLEQFINRYNHDKNANFTYLKFWFDKQCQALYRSPYLFNDEFKHEILVGLEFKQSKAAEEIDLQDFQHEETSNDDLAKIEAPALPDELSFILESNHRYDEQSLQVPSSSQHTSQLSSQLSSPPSPSGESSEFVLDSLDDLLEPEAIGEERIAARPRKNPELIAQQESAQQESSQQEPADQESNEQEASNILTRKSNSKLLIDETSFNILSACVPIELQNKGYEAAVGDFDDSIYQQNFDMDETKWVNYLKTLGITFGIDEKLVSGVISNFRARKSLKNLVVAQGIPATGHSLPYLYHSHAFSYQQKVAEDSKVDLRELQQRKIVKAGELVAEVRYKKQARTGMTVFGKKTPALPAQKFVVTIGENLIEKEPGFYYARFDGQPIIKTDYVFLSTTIVHNGDVNLATGNIHFSGDIEINGNIERGSHVTAGGSITVNGNVLSGRVKTGKDLIVKEGIISAKDGPIKVGGSLTAGFIENSSLVVTDKITVKRNILNSIITTGSHVILQNGDSVIAGGRCFSWGSVVSFNVGLKRGLPTCISLGVSPLIEKRIANLNSRIELVDKLQEEMKIKQTEALKGKAGSLKKKGGATEEAEVCRKYLIRTRRVIDKLTKQRDLAIARREYNHNAHLVVKKHLYSNSRIEICGKYTPLTSDMVSVAVVSRKKLRDNVIRLEQLSTIDLKTTDIDAEAEAS